MFVIIILSGLITQAGVAGNDWTDMVQEATTEVLKLGSSPMALLFRALLQFATKMASRSDLFTAVCFRQSRAEVQVNQVW